MEANPLKAYALRLTPGEEVISRILEMVKEKQLKNAFVLSCTGSVTSVTLRFADGDQSHCNKIETIRKQLEITALTGTICHNATRSHFHASFADENGSCIGGHVMGDMKVYTTAEIVLGTIENVKFSSFQSDETGFDELEVESSLENREQT